ncbi:multidrug effflux MFS transporter [Phenylobacterium sp.]|uniref:multidrug effflux MFS transporter n=1 Tax=Phenylobacterium sp. TaxID=1871053 RepID=UPI00273171AB|nr:multidrug effflux MFS transporter [Phenylobacterium sp.]MDP1599692.1 multidrug effflux MFS transporter [Phenylobacterium sp.]MDP3594942.1 multidrug effflux MFS transporter [Phenylobacterium sp.]
MAALSDTDVDQARTRLTPGTLFLLAGLAALGSLATNIILPAFPQIGAELNVSPRDLALTLSSFFVAFAFGQLLVGPLSDRFGRKWLVVGGLATFVLGCLVCALAGDISILILGRIIQALGACAASVLSRAIVRDLFDGEGLARALALTMIAMAASPGFSPLIGSALGGLFGWQTIFLGVASFAAVLAGYYWKMLGETHPVERRESLSLSAVGLAYVRLATNPRFILPALAVSLVIGALYTFFAAAPAVLISVLGLTGLQLALYFAGTVVIVFAAGFLAPRLARRWSPVAAGALGLGFAVAGSAVILAFAGAPNLVSITMGLTLFLFGMGLINPLGTAIALQPFGREAGTASALLGFLQMGCAAVGSTGASVLPMPPTLSLAAIMLGASLLAAAVFAPVGQRRLQAKAAA